MTATVACVTRLTPAVYTSGAPRDILALAVLSIAAVTAFNFTIDHADAGSHARAGMLATPHGEVATPVFMPVGTQGAVKAMTAEMLEAVGARLLLGNTYHLMLRPGAERVAEFGGLHAFTGWRRAMLTDSGGYQVFSLADRRRIGEDGVEFRSHLNGTRLLLTPERSIEVQSSLGADIAMVFDDCPPFPIDFESARKSLELTHRWAERSFARFTELQRQRRDEGLAPQALFGIVQGSTFEKLRIASVRRLSSMDFDGFAIGGLSVGEPHEVMYSITELVAPQLPAHRPRYLMGVGRPEDLLAAIAAGVDMFDCVLPTRNARNGHLFTSRGVLRIKNACYAGDPRPLDPACECPTCGRFSRAYLRHLFQAGEMTYAILATNHNLYFFLDTMRRVRQAIALDRFTGFRREYLAELSRGPE
jgi:queuine tRNA-ribosyltransferase